MEKAGFSVQSAVLPGVAAGSAFLAVTWLDSALSRHPFNDLKLVGQMFTTKSPVWQIQGLAAHFGFSVVMAALYDKFAYSKLPGPGWLRGILFLQIENNVLYLIAPLSDRIHAGKKRGEIFPLMNLKTYIGQTWRHIAFGAVLGALYRPPSGV